MMSGGAHAVYLGASMKRKILIALVGAVAAALAVVSILEWMTIRRLKQEIRQTFFSAIRPVRLANCTMDRFGSPHDGGYLLCANLLDQIESAYSYGIHADDNWGCDISKRHHVPVHQYDCFDLSRPSCPGGVFDFHEECVGAAAARIDNRPFDSVANQIARNGDSGKRLVVKMDVENAELDALAATSDEVLDKIDQLVVEFHRIDELRSVRLMDKLKKTFHIAYVHSNNFACPWGILPFTSGANEILFVNKRLAVVDGTGTATAAVSPLAVPNYPEMPDCQPTWQ
jgi:hypothetical protein